MNLSNSGRSDRRADVVCAAGQSPAGTAKSETLRTVRRRVQIGTVFIALLAMLGMGNVAAPVFADDYPTWADVQAVKGDVAKTNEKIAQIQALIAELEVQTEQARLLAVQRRHRDECDVTANGADADHWLEIIQAFAGPPGAKREKARA